MSNNMQTSSFISKLKWRNTMENTRSTESFWVWSDLILNVTICSSWSPNNSQQRCNSTRSICFTGDLCMYLFVKNSPFYTTLFQSLQATYSLSNALKSRDRLNFPLWILCIDGKLRRQAFSCSTWVWATRFCSQMENFIKFWTSFLVYQPRK